MQLQYTRGLKKIKNEYLYPASPTLINSLDVSENLKILFKKTRDNLLSYKENSTIQDPQLRPYQNQDVNFLMRLTQGKGVFNQQRTGKTPTTLVTMRNLKQDRCMIFVPKSAIYKWIQEYKKWHSGPVYTTAPSWNQQKRIKAYETFEGTLITNHDKASVDYDYLLENFKNCDAIVVDEAHILRTFTNNRSKNSKHSLFYIIDKKTNKKIKSYKTETEALINFNKETQYLEEHKKYNSAKVNISLIRLRKASKDAYALTGTPTGNYLYEIFGILTFLFPYLFTAYYPAIEYYFNINQVTYPGAAFPSKEIKDFKSEQKEKELLEFLETFSIQRKRKEVMQWLPKIEIEEIFLEPSTLQRKVMTELKTYFESGNIICENKLSVITALRQLTITPLKFELEDIGPKFQWILDLLNDYPDQQYFIVSQFTSCLKLLKKLLPKKFKTALLEGSTNNIKRYEIENEFQKGKINILLGNIQVTNVAMTLSKASHLIFLDQSLIQIENEQIQDRILPTTIEENENKEEQIITKLYIKESIDLYFREGLLNKKSQIEIINDYKRSLKKHV